MLRTWKLSAVCTCVTSIATLSALGQITPLHRSGSQSNTTSESKRQVSDESAAAAAAAASAVTGTFTAKFTIKLVTPVPSGSEVLCELSASASEVNTTTGTVSNAIEEGASAKATVSGSTATCNVSIPYSWYLSTPASDYADLSYYLYILNPTGANTAAETRYSTQYVPGAGRIKVPASGTTTTYTVSATL